MTKMLVEIKDGLSWDGRKAWVYGTQPRARDGWTGWWYTAYFLDSYVDRGGKIYSAVWVRENEVQVLEVVRWSVKKRIAVGLAWLVVLAGIAAFVNAGLVR